MREWGAFGEGQRGRERRKERRKDIEREQCFVKYLLVMKLFILLPHMDLSEMIWVCIISPSKTLK